jgi:hypothetical protein
MLITMDNTPKTPCQDKLAFDTKKQADTAGLVAELQHNAKLKSYRCTHCSLWHLASSN